jgi:hypothetical protein
MDEAIAAFYSGRVDGASFYHPALVMQQARVKKGKIFIPEPVVALATSAGIRREDDKQFRDFLSSEFDKYYKSGDTQFYEEFLKSRSIDPAKARRRQGRVDELSREGESVNRRTFTRMLAGSIAAALLGCVSDPGVPRAVTAGIPPMHHGAGKSSSTAASAKSLPGTSSMLAMPRFPGKVR